MSPSTQTLPQLHERRQALLAQHKLLKTQCSWCQGRGCLDCGAKQDRIDRELEALYGEVFPTLPEPTKTKCLHKDFVQS